MSGASWFTFSQTYSTARPIIVQYDLQLNFQWAKAYDMIGQATSPPIAMNWCFLSQSQKYLVSVLFSSFFTKQDSILITNSTDGTLKAAYMLATSSGTVLQRAFNFTATSLLSNDQTLVSTFTSNFTTFYVILTNISATAPSNNIASFTLTSATPNQVIANHQI